MKQYFWNVLIGIDQFANTIIGGDPDETISSRAGKAATRCQACRYLCRVLHWFDKNHCVESIENNEGDHEVWKWGGIK